MDTLVGLSPNGPAATAYLVLQWPSGNFGMLARCRNFFWSSCGGPVFVGPLFGRTCWTCLNPPLYACTNVIARSHSCLGLCCFYFELQAQVTFVKCMLFCIVCSNSLLMLLSIEKNLTAVFSTLFTHVKIVQVHVPFVYIVVANLTKTMHSKLCVVITMVVHCVLCLVTFQLV